MGRRREPATVWDVLSRLVVAAAAVVAAARALGWVMPMLVAGLAAAAIFFVGVGFWVSSGRRLRQMKAEHQALLAQIEAARVGAAPTSQDPQNG